MQASKPCLEHFKKSVNLSEDIINIVGWVKLVQYNAKNKTVQKFSQSTKTELIEELKRISSKKNLINNTEKLLTKHGIKFIVQEKPESAPIDGIAFWIDNNPAIGVTVRHKRIDNFIFTIMHELGHIQYHITMENAESILDIEKLNEKSKIEEEANDFARKSLIGDDVWELIKNNIDTDLNILKNGGGR